MSSRRRKQTARRWRIGALAAILAAVILIVLLGVFRIRTLSIEGNTRYPAPQIQDDLVTDFWSGNTLIFAWRYKNAVSEPKTPYLESVRAKIQSPMAVHLIVREKTLTGAVSYSGDYVYFDKEGTILEISDTRYKDIPLITGVTMSEPVLYSKLPVTSPALRNTILSIASLILDSSLQPDSIEFDENQNITLNIGTVQVQLGRDEFLEEKVANLETIYPRVENRKGSLNLTAFTGHNENITFVEDEPETETETGTASDGAAGSEDGKSAKTQQQMSSDEVFQCFDSYGNLHNDGHVVNGVVVDGAGNPIEGCSITEAGNVMDAYWNIITLQHPIGTGSGSSGTSQETQPETQAETQAQTEAGKTFGLSAFQAFDSYGNLHNDVHVVNGQVVDAYGNPIEGCSLNADGYVVDAYWNVIDPNTGLPI